MSLTPKEDYEMGHWRQCVGTYSEAHYRRQIRHWNLYPETPFKDVLEVGCGPLCGCLPYMRAKRRTGIDPLWKAYKKEKLAKQAKGVKVVSAKIEEIDCTRLKRKMFDTIISANSLDHGDDAFVAVQKIAAHLRTGGNFYLYVHLRMKNQLNLGHDDFITLPALQNTANASGLRERWISTWPADPTDKSPYRTLIGRWEKL